MADGIKNAVDLWALSCPLSLSTVQLETYLLRYTVPKELFLTGTNSGNNCGAAPVIASGIDRRFERMDTTRGSKRAGYTPSSGIGVSKKTRMNEESSSSTMGPLDSTVSKKKFRAEWLSDMESLLTDIMKEYVQVGKRMSWNTIHEMWLNRNGDSSISVAQIKSKWNDLSNKIKLKSTSTASTISPSLLTNTSLMAPSISTVQSNTMQSSSSSNSNSIQSYYSTLACIPPASTLLPTTNQHHVLSSNNYTLNQINNQYLPEAPKGLKFSKEEYDIFDYLLLKRLMWNPSSAARISWKNVAEMWITAAKVSKLNNPNANVYLRDKDVLDKKWSLNSGNYKTKFIATYFK